MEARRSKFVAATPIWQCPSVSGGEKIERLPNPNGHGREDQPVRGDRKSTRLNSSHSQISYAVFCLKKKKKSKKKETPEINQMNKIIQNFYVRVYIVC